MARPKGEARPAEQTCNGGKATVKFLKEFFGVVPEATSFFNTEGREFVVVVAEAAVA